MDHDTLIAVFVVIAAIAIVIQAAILLGFYLIARRIHNQVSGICREAKQNMDRVVAAAMEIITSSRDPLKAVTANVVEMSRIVRERTGLLDEAVGDWTEKIRQHVQRIDQLVSTFIEQADHTASTFQRSILGPLQEVGAIFKGVQSGIDFFFSRHQPSTARESTHDEEMFI